MYNVQCYFPPIHPEYNILTYILRCFQTPYSLKSVYNVHTYICTYFRCYPSSHILFHLCCPARHPGTCLHTCHFLCVTDLDWLVVRLVVDQSATLPKGTHGSKIASQMCSPINAHCCTSHHMFTHKPICDVSCTKGYTRWTWSRVALERIFTTNIVSDTLADEWNDTLYKGLSAQCFKPMCPCFQQSTTLFQTLKRKRYCGAIRLYAKE